MSLSLLLDIPVWTVQLRIDFEKKNCHCRNFMW